MTPLETAAYNFLLARSDRDGCSPTGDLVDFASEREKQIADELEDYFERDSGIIQEIGMDAYIESLRKG